MTDSVTTDLPWLIVGLEGIVTTAVPAARVDALAEATGLDPESACQRLWASGFVDDCCLGQLSLEEMIVGVRQRLGVDLTEAHLLGLWSLAYEPALDPIAELGAAQGYRLGVIADETPLFRAGFEAYLPEVEMLISKAWFSYEHMALTDDIGFYQSVAEEPELEGTMPTLVASGASQGKAAASAGWHVVPDLKAALHRS